MCSNNFKILIVKTIKVRNLLIVSSFLWKFLLLDFFIDRSSIKEFISLKKKIKIVFRKFLLIVNIFNMIAFMIFFAFFMFEKPFNLKHFISGVLSILQVSVALYRYIIIILNRREISKILQNLRTSYSIEDQRKYKFKSILKMFMLYRLNSMFLFVTAFIGAIVITISFWMSGNFSEYKVLYHFNIFFKIAAAFWMQFTFLTFLATSLVTEVFQYALIAILSIEFKILAYKFEHLCVEVQANEKIRIGRALRQRIRMISSHPGPSKSYWHKQMKSNSQISLNDLKPLIDRHNELFEIHKNLKNIFNVAFLMTFIQSSILLCFLAFRITISSDDRGFYISGLIRNFRNIFFQCYFGQILKDASCSIKEAIYRCGWENINDKSVKLALMMIIGRSQVPASFIVMDISEITLEQLTAIIMSTYSYYTLCLNLYHRKIN